MRITSPGFSTYAVGLDVCSSVPCPHTPPTGSGLPSSSKDPNSGVRRETGSSPFHDPMPPLGSLATSAPQEVDAAPPPFRPCAGNFDESTIGVQYAVLSASNAYVAPKPPRCLPAPAESIVIPCSQITTGIDFSVYSMM